MPTEILPLGLPIWLMITPLVGSINATLFFLIAGRRPASLGLYLVVAILAASAMHSVGLVAAGEPPFSIGDVHLISTSLAAWAALAISRLLGL